MNIAKRVAFQLHSISLTVSNINMGDAVVEDEDHWILSILTQQQQQQPQQQQHATRTRTLLTQNDFTNVRNRLLSDITSPNSGISSGKFWQEILSKASSFGFEFQSERDSTGVTAATATTGLSIDGAGSSSDTFPLPLNTKDGKKHVAATVALLGVTQAEAVRLTLDLFKTSDDDTCDLHKLVGTKQLLIFVRDYHYSLQVARMRIIVEAMRLECAYDDDDDDGEAEVEGQTTAAASTTKAQHKKLCTEFLDSIDGMDAWTSSSRGIGTSTVTNHVNSYSNHRDRGLFRLLVSHACAPVKMVGREEIYQACELLDHPRQSDASDIPMKYSSANPDFARRLMAEHFAHADVAMRTEALEALFVLFYQRISGGIDRAEFVLLLQALNAHSFFANASNVDDLSSGSGGTGGNRKSQLTALILAECMGLWRTVGSSSGKDGDDGDDDENSSLSWVDSHPFLSQPRSARKELDIIGEMLLTDLSNQVLERRRIAIMQSASEDLDDDKIEIPEAVALLTFGLLLKLSHSHCAQMDDKWASDIGVKNLALECVSKANDDCGAFGYLRHVMGCLLPSSLAKESLELSDAASGLGQVYDYTAIMLNGKNPTGGSPMKITNGETGEGSAAGGVVAEENSSVIYASIGREILVSTLSAFRSSLSRSLAPAKVDNMGMFCHLATNIHRNSDQLRQKFWSDWDATPQGSDLLTDGILASGSVDPLVYLLDVAHSVAIDALATLGDESSREEFISADCGRGEAAILPCISPFLGMLSSLIPLNGAAATAIIKALIPDGMILACLRGVYHICAEGNSQFGSEGEHNRLVDASRKCMESIRILSNIAAEEDNEDCADWLRAAMQCYVPTSNLHGAPLLYCIAEACNDNISISKSIALGITADALYTIANSCVSGKCDQEWVIKVGQSFSSERDNGFRTFAAHINKVTVSFTYLLSQLSLLMTDISLTTDRLTLESVLDFMKISKTGAILACDIISSSPQQSHLSDDHRCIIMNSLKTITSTLRIMNGIASCHRDENVRDTAMTIRNDIIDSLATSTSLGANIGFFASVPVLGHFSTETGSGSDFSLASSDVEEKKDGGYVQSSLLDDKPAPKKYDEKSFTITRSAMILLKAWSDIVEKMAMENTDYTSETTSLQNLVQKLPSSQRSSMASILVSLGPARLILSSVSRPAKPSTTLFSLMAAFISWFVEGGDNGSRVLGDTALIAIELMTSTLIHGNLDASNQDFSSFFKSFDFSSHSVGVLLHNVLSVLFDTAMDSSCKTRSMLMVRTLNFLQFSIAYQSSVANNIFQGSSDNESLVTMMLDKMNAQDFNKHQDAIIASSCCQVFTTLWKSCRSHCTDSAGLQSPQSIHPCDALVRTLVESKKLIRQVTLILERFSSLLPGVHDEHPLDEISIYHRYTVLNVLCCAARVLEIDAISRYDSETESIKFLSKVAADNKIVEWLKAIERYDGIIATVRSSEKFNNILQISRKTSLAPIALNDVSAVLLMTHEISEPIRRAMLQFHASCQLQESQSDLIISLSALGDLTFSTIRQDFRTIRIAVQAVNNLSKVAENGLEAYSQTVTATYSVPLSQTVVCGGVLLSSLLSCVSKLSRPDVTDEDLILLVDKLLRSSERLLVLAESLHDDELGMKLRLSTAACAISMINVMTDRTNKALSYETVQLWKATRSRLCQFSSETFAKIMEGHSNQVSDQLYCDGNRSSTQSDQMNKLNTLHSSISLLTTVVSISKKNREESLSQQSFHTDLSNTFKSNRTLEWLSAHMEIAANYASKSYHQKGKATYNEAAFETVQRILSFASILCDEQNSILSEMIASGTFIQVILNNSILRTACEEWTSMPRDDQDIRGYLQKAEPLISFSSKQPSMIKDPAHEIWRITLQIIAGLLYATNEETTNIVAVSKAREHAANIAIDFLHFFETPITSFLENIFSQSQSPNPGSSTPSSGINFTVATIGELSDILALVSELCAGEHGKQFESSSPRLYIIMSTVALAVCRSLSLFLGALGTAREIFTVLNRLNDVMGQDMNQSAAAIQYQSSSSHPLLADGINNAKHQAIRNALYASSCCSCMTPDEYALSPLGQSNNNQKTPVDLESAFHSHVSNDFIYQMEDTVSQCMFSALSIIHKMHPSTTAFVVFSDHEAAQLNLSSAPPIGAMVAIRSGIGSKLSSEFLCSSVTIRYGRVIHYNAISKTLDVEYFDELGLPVERQVEMSRLAALEDVSKRFNVFDYKPAPESVSDNTSDFTTSGASIGDLILILRWCKEQALSQSSSTTGNRPSLQVKSVANLSSIIVGNEISIHQELGSPQFAKQKDVKSINNQLLNLFDDEASLQNFDLSAPTVPTTKSSALENVIEKEVWKSIQLQLENSLLAARTDRDIARKIAAEQGGGMGAQYWASTPKGTHTRSNRRSPFF